MIAHYRKFQASPAWRYLSYGIAGLVLAPVLVIFASWMLPVLAEHWQHLWSFILPEILWNTLLLLGGVSLLSGVLGVGLAWVCSQYEFVGATFLRRALIFPFAVPAYVSAFVYVGLVDFAGPVRRFLRESFLGDAWFPEIRSITGAIVLLSLSLYPYVYVLAYDAFSSQGRNLREAARSLGSSPRQVFLRLALPFARPWIAGGLCLVLLEVLNDFGTVSVVGISTFTTAIYKVWYGFFSVETAAQLSTFLILIAFGIYSWEQISRRRREYNSQAPHRNTHRVRLAWPKQCLAAGSGFIVFTLAFALPLIQMLIWAARHYQEFASDDILRSIGRTAFLGSAVGISASVLSAVIVLSKRFFPIPKLEFVYRVAQLGYGIPGSVLAIGVFLPLVKVDHWLSDWIERTFQVSTGLLLTGTVVTMVIALSIRFLAVSSSSLNSGLERVSWRLDEAASIFGVYGLNQFRLIHWPLMKASFFSAFLLVFIDVVKEMPLTLMTRPFGWDTLSVRIYSLISEGEWERAAVPAVFLVLVGIVPLLFFSSQRSKS